MQTLPDLSPFLHTHMPFYSPRGEGGVWFFCARDAAGEPWRLATTLSGKAEYYPLAFPKDWNICGPCASWDAGEWDISFIGGPIGGPYRLFSLQIDGSEEAHNPRALSTEPAVAGFARADWVVTADRRGPIRIRKGNYLRTITIYQAKYIYRVAYNPWRPHQLWVTADIDGAYRLLRFNDDEPADAVELVAPGRDLYKGVPVGDNAVAYASRSADDGFEERHIAICEDILEQPAPEVAFRTEAEADSLSCVECFRKHISAAIGFSKEIWDGHGEGDHLDHRADLAAEISQAELHADALGIDGYRQALRSLRHSLEFTKWDPTQANIDLMKRLWESSLAVTCPTCGSK